VKTSEIGVFVLCSFQWRIELPAPYDPRIVANALLEVAAYHGKHLTNLSLQKLLYFCHARFLLEKNQPLVKGHFEAWKFGPVHPVVYEAFKECGSDPIKTKANAIDPISRKEKFLPPLEDESARQYVLATIATFGGLETGRLVDISHAPNGPWDVVVKRARESVSLGMKIPDSLIKERFKFHKISISKTPKSGEPHEDAPLT
jgi:uncharacterized phage-associated protein